MNSKAKNDRAIVPSNNDQKSVRFVDAPSPFDNECSSAEFEAPIRRRSQRNLMCSDMDAEGDLSEPQRDPELYCIPSRSCLLPEDALDEAAIILHEGITKADGSPVQSILKKGKINNKNVMALSDSSLASNPWNLSSKEDMIAPLIPQRYLSEDLSTDDGLEAPLSAADQANNSRQMRRETNRDVFLRQFLRKT